MNPRSVVARTGVGAFSVALGVVLLFMLGGLLVADQALSRAASAQAQIDAEASAALIQRVLDGRVEALHALEAPLLEADSATRASRLAMLGDALARRSAASTERGGLHELWVEDERGRTLYDTMPGVHATGTAARPRPDRARVRGLATARAVPTNAPAVEIAPPGAGDDGAELIVVVPLVTAGRVLGTVGAAYGAAELLAPVVARGPRTRGRLTLTVGEQTVLRVARAGASSTSTERWRTPVTMPGNAGGSAEWHVEALHTQASEQLRIAIWALGLMAVLSLAVLVIRERRQAMRVAERSAELERLNADVLRANRMKSEFLANVSHELRTPLNAIVGFVDLLRDGVYGDLAPRQVPPVERIAASATHLRHLVDQVLDIAKIAAGRLEVHPEVIALRPFVLNVASELESLIAERELTLSIAVGASLPRVRTDPAHLRQVLINLIGNAVKYTPSGGIAVRARLATPVASPDQRRRSPEDPTLLARAPDRTQSWIALQVIDTGVGIAPADQARIFDEFEQVNAGPRGESMQRGTGLGLAISRRLARLLGGDLTVESQLGKGSTFTLWLPVSAADLQSDTPSGPETPVVGQPAVGDDVGAR